MLLGKEDLISQQKILAALGFYTGSIDGIWSTETITAKVAFERSKSFKPAVPTNGLPFRRDEKLPIGIVRQRDGRLWCAELDTYLKNEKARDAAQAKTSKESSNEDKPE